MDGAAVTERTFRRACGSLQAPVVADDEKRSLASRILLLPEGAQVPSQCGQALCRGPRRLGHRARPWQWAQNSERKPDSKGTAAHLQREDASLERTVIANQRDGRATNGCVRLR